MKNIYLKNSMSFILLFIIYIFCWLTNLAYGSSSDKGSIPIKIEFRQISKGLENFKSAMKGNKIEGYKIMTYKEPNPVPSHARELPFLVSEKAEIEVTRHDIEEVYAEEIWNGTWMVIIVLKKEKIPDISEFANRNLGNSIAILMNGDFIMTL